MIVGRAAALMGFAGKACIHKSQVPIAHQVFSSDHHDDLWVSMAQRRLQVDELAPHSGRIMHGPPHYSRF